MYEFDQYIEQLERGSQLTERDFKNLLNQAKELFIEEANVQYVNSPVNICGDIHGQFHDLLKLFKEGGDIKENKYIFLGDLVDRGRDSVETLSLLLAYKVR